GLARSGGGRGMFRAHPSGGVAGRVDPRATRRPHQSSRSVAGVVKRRPHVPLRIGGSRLKRVPHRATAARRSLTDWGRLPTGTRLAVPLIAPLLTKISPPAHAPVKTSCSPEGDTPPRR